MVRLRVKGKDTSIGRTFKDEETATLFGILKEMAIEEADDFGVSEKDVTRMVDAFELKYKDDPKAMGSVLSYFSDISDRALVDISYEDYISFVKEKLKTPVYKGGKRDNGTGRAMAHTVGGVIRKFAYLSAAISHCVGLGMNLENIPLRVIGYLRTINKDATSIG
jgi:hypothetical protein